MRLGQLAAQRRGDRARHPGGQLHFVKMVAVTLEESNVMPVEAQDLIPVGGLQHPQQGFDMEAPGGDSQFANWPLEFDHPEQAGGSENRQTVPAVIPEVRIDRQCLEGSQQRACLHPGILA
jgi:hypothetical protein